MDSTVLTILITVQSVHVQYTRYVTIVLSLIPRLLLSLCHIQCVTKAKELKLQ